MTRSIALVRAGPVRDSRSDSYYNPSIIESLEIVAKNNDSGLYRLTCVMANIEQQISSWLYILYNWLAKKKRTNYLK
jgi:hypothetical protein